MKLWGSLVTTALIVAGVWGVALLQLSPVIAAENRDSTSAEVDAVAIVEAATTKTQIESNPRISPSADTQPKGLIGVTSYVNLSQVDQVWQQFNSKISLHQRLKVTPKNVYVLYQNFDPNYQSADVTIGYAKRDIGIATETKAFPNGEFQTLLQKALYSNAELGIGWESIDYRRPVSAVIEVHHLNSLSESVATELFVKYK